MKELKITCYECGAIIEGDGIEIGNGEHVCEECYDGYYVTCEHCGDIGHIDNSHYVNDVIVCDDCYDRLYTECSCCDEAGERSAMYDTADGLVCEYCYDEHYVECQQCGEMIHIDNSRYDEHSEEYFCVGCYEERDNGAINDYYYKPTPVFYGKNDAFYMGVELEIDGAGENGENAQRLIDIDDDTHIYIKHDGSLNNGFEIVSHPATLEYHQNFIEWDNIMREALEMGYKSHDAETCGLHIHVSKKALGSDFTKQDESIAKILYFFEKHYNKFLKFSRRTESQLDRWATRYGIDDGETTCDILNKAKSTYNRYRIINLQNAHTIEFRLFRGTLRYTTFIATLQLVRHICELCVETEAETIEAMQWEQFIETIKQSKNNYSELLEYLKIRKLIEEVQ